MFETVPYMSQTYSNMERKKYENLNRRLDILPSADVIMRVQPSLLEKKKSGRIKKLGFCEHKRQLDV